MERPILGFIGFGEAAYNICLGLKETSRPAVYAYDLMWQDERLGPAVRSRAAEAGVELVSSLQALIDAADVALCATSAKYALAIANAAAAFIRPGKIYADLNSASPMAKREIAETIDSTGARFVDAAVMEIVPPHRHRVPIAVSGTGAKSFADLLNPLGMNVEYVNDSAGSSSSMKMFRSIFMKGLTSLMLETLLASHAAGVVDQVMASISSTLTKSTPEELANLLINRTAVAADRRVGEMKDVAATLAELGLEGVATEGTIKRLQWICDMGLKERLGGKVPDHYRRVLEAASAAKS